MITAFAASEVVVVPASITISGASKVVADAANLITNIYGGTAGLACVGDGSVTCNSCTPNVTLTACNQTSVYPALNFTVTFRISKDIAASSAIAAIYMANDGDSGIGTQIGTATFNSPTASATTISISAPWSSICGASCNSSSDITLSKKISFGIDYNASGTVDADEVKSLPLKFQNIAVGSAATSQSFCPATAQIGACNVTLKSGDQKAIITNIPVLIGTDPSGILWNGLAFFPIEVAGNMSGDTLAFTSFNRGSVSPIVKDLAIGTNNSLETTDNYITGGGIENYHRYCFVYGSRNLAGNIYRFVGGVPGAGAAAATACVTPSKVVGVLDDKHCFISTAAFGSDMAPEVQTFREFRNQFLLSNTLGREFIKFYYQAGPPAAEFISQSEILRGAVRAALYPVLGFVYLSLNYGILMALFVSAVLLILLSQVRYFLFGNKKIAVMLLIVLLTPLLRAQQKPSTKSVEHPGAAEGLIRIKKDGTYIYDLKRKLRNQSGHLRVGQANQPNITIDIEQRDASGNPSGTKNFKFDDFYEGASKLILGYDYEWFPFIEHGKLGLQGGFSAMMASGHGRLVAVPNDASEEKFTFVTVPFTLGAVYRLELKDKQLLAPYVSGGGTYLLLSEKREDKSNPHFAGGFGFYGSGGMMINLGFIDPESSLTLDSEYGISNMWLSLEFKVVEVQASAFGFSNQYFNAGLSFDF